MSGGHQAAGAREAATRVMAQHIYATTTTSSGCARPATTPPLFPAPTPTLLPLPPSSSSRLPRRRGSRGPVMGSTGHLDALAVAAAAKPRNGGRPCAAVLGDPLPALDDDPTLLVHPSPDFAAQALVSSTQQVTEYRSPLPFPAFPSPFPFRFVPIRMQNGWRARVRPPALLRRRRVCGWSLPGGRGACLRECGVSQMDDDADWGARKQKPRDLGSGTCQPVLFSFSPYLCVGSHFIRSIYLDRRFDVCVFSELLCLLR